jgi:hypothetical protein
VSPSRRRRRASPAWEGRPTISVATLPGRGLYARHLGHPEGVDAVHRTTLGPPGCAGSGATFDRAWLSRHLDAVDIVHVHGIRPSQTPEDIAATAEFVRASGTPLVVTGYHLSDPSSSPSGGYPAQLDALIPRADAVITLTESAAAEMRERWDVDPLVLPHPHAVDFVRMRQPRPRRGNQMLVGMHLAALQLRTDPVQLVEALSRAVSGIEQARLAVHVHETVLDPGSFSFDQASVRRIDTAVRAVGGVLRVHRPFSESQLWDHLFALDVSIVPGVHGSHSVWPEACADLGTHAVLPAATHAAGQRPCLTYESDGDSAVLTESLGKALWQAHEQSVADRAQPEQRWNERVAVAESLRCLYERLLGLDRR